MIFFFSNEMITVVVLLVVGDDMQYKPRLHAFIRQILMELSLCTSDYSRHLDYFKKKKNDRPKLLFLQEGKRQKTYIYNKQIII